MSKKYTLLIKSVNNYPTNYYDNYQQHHEGDAGVDLRTPCSITIPARSQGKIKFGVACQNICKTFFPNIDAEFMNSVGYFLAPRSSISKTPLRMSNSIGIIDAGYRGEIMAVVDNISDNAYLVEKDTRLFQLLNTDLVPFSEVSVVESLSETSRGDGGFGSTNISEQH